MRRARYRLIGLVVVASTPSCKREAPPPPPPVPVVRVVEVEPTRVDQVFEWLATLDGSTNAEIRPRVSGVIERVAYQEGAVIAASDPMFVIDKHPFVAALEQARGAYEAALAQHAKAKADVARYTPLVAERAISREELDNARAAERTAAANVEAAAGNLKTARLNLEWTDVRSPISGLAGIAQTRVGNLVDPTRVLAIVSQLDPIRASFHIPEVVYLNAAEALNHIDDTPNAARRYLELLLANGRVHPQRARRVIVGRELDPSTGTLLIQALFPNPGNLLRPGLFARVRVHTGAALDVMLVPQRALRELQGTPQLMIVDGEGRAAVRSVKVAGTRGPDVQIAAGLSPGDRVIVEGQQNLQPGARVNAQPLAAR